jgi:uncharacterized protein (DUF433 family)
VAVKAAHAGSGALPKTGTPRRTAVDQTVRSSKQSTLFKRLAKDLPDLLLRPPRTKVAKPRQTQRRLTPQQVERLVAEYQAGAGMKELAARWEIHRTTVAAQLRRAGVELRRRGIPVEELPEAIRLYGEGWSCQRLAARYGCDDETVRQVLKRTGLILRDPWDRRP